MPSLAQMLVRANDMHIRLLRAAMSGRPLETAAWSPGSFRGARVAAGTLLRWGCLEEGQVTERGKALVSAWDAKFPGANAKRPQDQGD